MKMSEAFKCDRCGHYGHWADTTTLYGSIIQNALKHGWCPSKIDLCSDCANQLRTILFEWWNSEKVVD